MLLEKTVVVCKAYVVGSPAVEVTVNSLLSTPLGELEMSEEFASSIWKWAENGNVLPPPVVEAKLYAKLPFVQIADVDSPDEVSLQITWVSSNVEGRSCRRDAQRTLYCCVIICIGSPHNKCRLVVYGSP